MTSPTVGHSLRKVAIVLASLDAETADALIDQMPAERARQVRQALVDLDDLDAAEQAGVVSEFLRQGQAAKHADLAGVEVETSLATRLELSTATYRAEVAAADAGPHASLPVSDQRTTPGAAPLFSFLHSLAADELAAHLEQERPQMLAVVVSHLPAERSADLLSRLSGELRADVLRRVAELGEIDPQMVREVEQALHCRLAERAMTPSPRRRGPSAVDSILEAADADARERILESLAAHQPALAARFAPPPPDEPALAFDDLAQLPELSLSKIFGECESQVLMLALAGARPAFARRALEQLPARDARQLRRQLDGLGPTRLSDVERAQHDVVAVARQLHAAGRIELTARRALSLTI